MKSVLPWSIFNIFFTYWTLKSAWNRTQKRLVSNKDSRRETRPQISRDFPARLPGMQKSTGGQGGLDVFWVLCVCVSCHNKNNKIMRFPATQLTYGCKPIKIVLGGVTTDFFQARWDDSTEAPEGNCQCNPLCVSCPNKKSITTFFLTGLLTGG